MNGTRNQQVQLQSQIYAAILSKIIRGEYPPGSRLVEEELAKIYNVSRTPIREVLVALGQDGLVQRPRNRGARVTSFSSDDVEEIYEIRQALECFSVRHAAGNLVPLNRLLDLERRLDALNQSEVRNWNEQQAVIDLELHRLIVSYSRNRRLMAYLEKINLLVHSLRLIGYSNDDHARSAGREHLAIVRALLQRDADLAERLLSDHMENSKRHALELFLRRDV